MPPNAGNSAAAFNDPILLTENERRTDAEILLDGYADTDGLKGIKGEDWTDVKHSERKKRDRILDDGVLLKLMRKSDYQGFKRLFINVGLLAATGYCISLLGIRSHLDSIEGLKELPLQKVLLFVVLYVFYGFQYQCFAFAGHHELLHGNAFKTKRINNFVCFCVSTVCFEYTTHERLMHKQHHTFTNNINKDPELTSFYSREELENPEFRNVASSRFAWFLQFVNVWFYLKCRMCRLINSARSIPVDYSGTSWNMKEWSYGEESGIIEELRDTARLQLLIYFAVAVLCGQSKDLCSMLLFYWLVPVVVGYMPINFFRNAEHADCEVSEINNSLRNTRSVRSNWFIRLLLWETNFHVEHHAYPMVPFFNLPKLNELLDDHIIHNEHREFTSQNWAIVKPSGWIDEQSYGMKKKRA